MAGHGCRITLTHASCAIAGRGLAAIAEAERHAPPEEGMMTLELEVTTQRVFGPEHCPHTRPPSQRLEGILCGQRRGTFHADGVAPPYTKEKFMEIYPHWRDPTVKLTVAEEKEESASNEGGWGSAGGWGTSDTSGWGAATSGNTGGWGAAFGGGREKKRDLLLFLLVALRAALLLHYLHLTPREPTFVPGTISGTNISYSVIRDREFLTLMLNTASNEEEEEEAADAAAVEAPPVPEEDLDAVRARYMRTSGFRADDAL
ncbi:unnamed protein product [Closterium sp. NIES-54]